MSISIQLKHSSVSGKAPLPTDLDAGELALNTNEDTPAAYLKDSAGNVVQLAGAGSVSTPDASETVKGIAELATQAEVTTGTDDTTIVTPLKLRQSELLKRTGTVLSPSTTGDDFATTGDIQSTSQNGGPLAGFRNQVINGDMRQWQRGANIASGSQTNQYTADRWYATANATNTSVSRVRNGPAGFSFCMETNASITNIQQGIELTAAGEPGQFAIGTTWTLSVWSTYNLAGTTTFFNFRDNVGSGTNSVTAASPAAPVFASTGETSNGFTRYSATFSIASGPVSTNTNGSILINTGNTAGAQFTGVQLEPGPVATPFEHRPISVELSLCQRYFQRISAYQSAVFMSSYTTTMRVTPTTSNITNGAAIPIKTADVYVVGAATSGNAGIFSFDADAEL